MAGDENSEAVEVPVAIGSAVSLAVPAALAVIVKLCPKRNKVSPAPTVVPTARLVEHMPPTTASPVATATPTKPASPPGGGSDWLKNAPPVPGAVPSPRGDAGDTHTTTTDA